MKALLRLVPVVVLAVLLAVLGGVGYARAQGDAGTVVGPGESIQKAVNAAHPGDTIVVKGVHKEDVVIRKDGIQLRGYDAVIEAPPKSKADSPCSKVFGPEGICILGGVNLQNGQLTGPRVKDVGVSGFTLRGFEQTKNGTYAIDVPGAQEATIVGNRFVGNDTSAIGLGRNIGTTIARNHIVANPKEADSDGIDVGDYSRNTRVLNNDVRGIAENHSAIAVERNSVDTTIARNDLEDNWNHVFAVDSPGTKIVSNEMKGSGIVGIYMAGPKQANNDAKVVGNDISGGPWGIYVEGAHGGSIVGNDVRDNCAGIWFEVFKDEPVGGFEVKGNTLADNTRSCKETFGRNFSGIGIALLGAHDMKVTANHLWGNMPTGPTPISGGVVVSKDPYFQDTNFGGKQKPKDNTVSANHFGRNKPDIFWDKSGSGNSFVANVCDTSVPSSLCN